MNYLVQAVSRTDLSLSVSIPCWALIVILQNVILQNVILLNVILLSVILLESARVTFIWSSFWRVLFCWAIMLMNDSQQGVIQLTVILLNVVAPFETFNMTNSLFSWSWIVIFLVEKRKKERKSVSSLCRFQSYKTFFYSFTDEEAK